ncbi:MAG: autotransporter-associated beta strand repeat-containing protein [Akkermansiaceae bacterium]
MYYVTNLNNNGAGSLRTGLDTAPATGRTIIFAVSGYIPVVSDTNFDVPSKVTIAGQTAPGDGVGLRGGRMLISGSNSVMRHFRIRHGRNGTGGDCLNIASTASSTMLDHISMMFSTDENFSFFNSSVNNFTMQYSNTSWGMERHNAGGLWDLQNGSCHHTLWAHHRTRNPKARPGMLEWINNVTFHWRSEGFIMGDSQTPANWKANVRGCYYISIEDPDDNFGIKSTALVKAQVATNGVPNFSLYLNDTLFDNNDNGLVDGTNRGYGIVSGSEFTPGDAVGANRYYKSATPFAGATGAALVTVDDPKTAYKKVISSASPLRLDANFTGPLRDELDSLLTDSVVNQYSILVQKDGKIAGEDPTRTTNGEQLLADQYGITNNGFGTLNGTTPPTDSDLDGMPDVWEITLNGLNGMAFNVALDDHNTVFTAGQITNTFFPASTPLGYTYLEEYLHFRAVPHATVVKNTAIAPSSQTIDLRKFTDGFTNAPAFTVTGIVNGTVQQFLPNGTAPSPAGPIVKFIPTLDAIGRAGFNFTVVDAESSQWTQQFALLISAIAAPRDLVWIGDGVANAWNGSASNWRQPSGAATAFGTGDTALFDDRGSATPAINITASQTPGSVLVTGTKNYTLGGSGSIASTGTLTKAGDTTLTLATSASFAAGTFLNGGTTIINNNCTLGGGTIRFSGGSTLTSAWANNNTNAIPFNQNFQVDAGSTGNINLSQRSELNGSLSGGGTFNIFSPSNLGTEGRVYFDGASAGCTGQVNLSGGATSLGNGGRMVFRANGGSFNGFGSARVALSGLDLFTTNNSSGNTYALGELSGDTNSRLRSNYLNGGGATTWTIGARNTNATFAGVIMDGTRQDGSNSPTNLFKTGSGVLTLSGSSSYTGTTTVSAGTLRVNGSLGATSTTVASGATLGGSGTLGGSLTIASGGSVDPGAAPQGIGTLTVANGLTLPSGCNLLFDLTSNPTGANDRISVTAGSLSQTGVLNFKFNTVDGFLSAGTYSLVADAPTSSANTVSFTHNFPANTRQTFTLARSSTGATTTKSIWLTVGGTAGSLTWTGGTSVWDIANTTPWSGGPSGDQKFYNLDNVTFDDSATNRTATLSAGLEPRIITVNHSGNPYLFNGTGSLAGAAQLVKSGTGTLNISNTSANTFTGGTFLNGGTLSLTNTNSPLGTGIITVNGGTLLFPPETFLSNSMVFTGSSALASTSGNTAILNSTTGTMSSVGSANVNLSGIAGILSINGSMSSFTGTLSFGAGSGMLRLSAGSTAANFGSAGAHFDLGSGSAHLTNRNGNITIRLGAVSGGPNTRLQGRQSGSGATVTRYIVGELNTSTTFSGIISNSGDQSGLNLTKTGTGTWTLGGTSDFIGAFEVSAGTLAISGSTLSSNAATVTAGATLSLAGGTFGAASVNNLGTLSGYGTLAADLDSEGNLTGRGFTTGVPGTLQVGGSAFFDSSSQLRLRGGVSSDLVAIAGDLTLAGTVQISLAPGTSFGRYPLMTCGGSITLGTLSLTGTSGHLSTTIPGRVDLVIDDSDEDGLPDSWEQTHFGNLAQTPAGDKDGDGSTNRVEFRLNLNPSSGGSAFRATISGHTLTWPSAPGVVFTVKRSLTLESGNWPTLGTVTGGAGTTSSYTDSANFGRAFYRIEFVP